MTKPIAKKCYKLLYVIQGVKSNFLASADIKAFGRTCLLKLLLIGLTLFLHPRCFCLASYIIHEYYSIRMKVHTMD